MADKDEEFVSNESQLVRCVVWDKNEVSLAEFVEKYELPQLVCVETGYYGTDERSALSGGQLLTLHKLYNTPKMLCEPSVRSAVVIPLTCPDVAEILPLPKDCEHSRLRARQLAELRDNPVKYLRVLETSAVDEEDCAVGDILELKSTHKKSGRIKCVNIDGSSGSFYISFNSLTLFAPLVDYRTYTLAKLKERFGLPTKVRFVAPNCDYTNESPPQECLSNLGEVLVLGEYTDTVVIATTICENVRDKVCITIPKDLEITVVTPRALLTGEKQYQRIVNRLHQGFHAANLNDFPDMDVYQHILAVRKAMEEMPADETVQDAPRSAKELLPGLSHKAYVKETCGPPPALKPRVGSLSANSPPPTSPKPTSPPPTSPPPTSPKPKPPPPTSSPTPLSKSSRQGSSKTFPRPKFTKSLPAKFRQKFNLTDKGSKCKAEQEDSKGREDAGQPKTTEESTAGGKNEAVYSCIDESSDDDEKEYDYIDIEDKQHHHYEKFVYSDGQKSKSFPAGMQDCKHKIDISKIPQDISSLKVPDVGNVLVALNMPEFVELFKTELIDGVMLASMDESVFHSLNIDSFHARKLLNFISGWRPNL